MTRSQRRALNEKRAAEVRRAADLLAEDAPAEEVEAARDRIEGIEEVLSRLPGARTVRVTVAIGVAVIATGLVGLAWTARLPSTRVVLHAKLSGLSFTLEEPWSWSGHQPLEEDGALLQSWTRIELPEHGKRRVWRDGEPLELEGRSSLVRLDVGEGAGLQLEQRDGSTLDLAVEGGAASGVLLRRGEAPIPDSVRFELEASARGAEAELRLDGVFELGSLGVRDLAFLVEERGPAGTLAYRPALRSGRLELPAVARTLTLRNGDGLSLAGARGRIVRIAVGDGIEMVFEGTAGRVRIGPTGYDRDATPRVLEYLYANQPVSLLWAALAGSWGLLWSVRTLLE